ncbi:sodium:solute symporter [Nafulsella turpanensis]|uniref:sodium:solute symporter n=1 Tax=Nafulsella turpanensis TaxID=1265690 RepID=UPI00034A2CB2|nr:sodium:solute symporter [Nafulsella turpanensis]
MDPILVIVVIAAYFCLLLLISYLTSRGETSDSETFFTANRQSPWYLVAFGMIGASLSGVTFISIPGEVGSTGFSYFQVVMGYMVGYFVIGSVLLPLYYRLNLISIYGYLEQRFGFWSYKTGAFYFLISRIVGAAFRLFLVAGVLQLAVFDAWELPFWVTVAVTIGLIWLYTFKGGIKTIVYTDTLQTAFMLLAVCISIYLISEELSMGMEGMLQTVQQSEYSKMFFWNFDGANYFWKQFIAGAFIAIVMTGLDQDMMQKNLTCRSLGDAQKNMFWFSSVLLVVNLFFLCLGALLYIYIGEKGIAMPERTDNLYPMLALDHFPLIAGVLFLLGIIAAAYSSADSALTALTTSFCVDFLEFRKKPDEGKKKIRTMVHIGFSIILFLVILAFNSLNDKSVISQLFKAAGFTYGPLLGLFAFGLFTRRQITDRWAPLVCFLTPLIAFGLDFWSEELFGGFKFGFFILLVNGVLTFVGLWLISRPATTLEGALTWYDRHKVAPETAAKEVPAS